MVYIIEMIGEIFMYLSWIWHGVLHMMLLNKNKKSEGLK